MKNLICTIILTLFCGCTALTSPPAYNISSTVDLTKTPLNTAQLVSVTASPTYNILDSPSKAWIVNIDGKIEFIPLDSESSTMGKIWSQVVVPVR